jgi:hypothetical protein
MRPLGPSTPPKYFPSEEMVLEMSIVVNDEVEGFRFRIRDGVGDVDSGK